MHDIDTEPLAWLAEFLFGMLHVSVVTFLTGLWTVFTIRLSLPARLKVFLNVLGVVCLSLYASTIFDPVTHTLGCVSAAISMAFTAPLQAAAWVQRKLSKPDDGTTAREMMLRIAIPGAIPTAENPAQPPMVHLLRGVAYLTAGNLARPVFFSLLHTPGIKQDLLGMFFVIAIATGALNMAAALLASCGVAVASPFRAPLLSTSLGDFWGRRWNKPVSDALRMAIYEPMVKGGWGKGSSSMACFVVSAVAHEFILWHCGVRDSRGEWMCFFVLCGVMAGVERHWGKSMGRWGKYLFAIGSFYVLFHFFFLGVAIRSGFAERGVKALGTAGVLMGKAATDVMLRFELTA